MLKGLRQLSVLIILFLPLSLGASRLFFPEICNQTSETISFQIYLKDLYTENYLPASDYCNVFSGDTVHNLLMLEGHGLEFRPVFVTAQAMAATRQEITLDPDFTWSAGEIDKMLTQYSLSFEYLIEFIIDNQVFFLFEFCGVGYIYRLPGGVRQHLEVISITNIRRAGSCYACYEAPFEYVLKNLTIRMQSSFCGLRRQYLFEMGDDFCGC